MRVWLPALILFFPLGLLAQRPHLNVPPKGSPDRVQLVGTVTDSLTGKPVYDCLVAYYGVDGQRRSISSVNSDGLYSMFIPAHEPFELRVEKEDGYRDLHKAIPAIAEGKAELRLDLVLRPN